MLQICLHNSARNDLWEFTLYTLQGPKSIQSFSRWINSFNLFLKGEFHLKNVYLMFMSIFCFTVYYWAASKLFVCFLRHVTSRQFKIQPSRIARSRDQVCFFTSLTPKLSSEHIFNCQQQLCKKKDTTCNLVQRSSYVKCPFKDFLNDELRRWVVRRYGLIEKKWYLHYWKLERPSLLFLSIVMH